MQIVILGAGYAGLRAALDLAEARREGKHEHEVVLVERNDYHQVITWLHQVAAETLPAERARIPLAELLEKGGLAVVKSEVKGIEPSQQRVVTEAGAIRYDQLIVGLGSETIWPPIPGLREHALPMRWWHEAVALKAHIEAQFAAAAATQDEAEQRARMTIVVVGGGYTGTQLAGELAHWTPELADKHTLPLAKIRLLLIEARDRLMASWDADKTAKAVQILRRKGVDVRLSAPLEEVGPAEIKVAGEAIPCHTLVWAGGVRPPKLLADAGLPADEKSGRVRVDGHLRAEGFSNIIVIGDSSLYLDDGEPLPGTAAHALRQGAYVAEMLIAQSQGKPYEPYEPTKLGILVAVGGLDAVGDALGVPLIGTPAGLLKEGVERWYLTTIGAYP